MLAVASPALRATSFVLFVLFCNGVPFTYQLAAKLSRGKYHAGADVPTRYLLYWGCSLATFTLGLCVKSAMLPERAVRSRFTDLFCNSHQLWHLCINAGFVLGTFLAWGSYLDWRRTAACPAGANVLGGSGGGVATDEARYPFGVLVS